MSEPTSTLTATELEARVEEWRHATRSGPRVLYPGYCRQCGVPTYGPDKAGDMLCRQCGADDEESSKEYSAESIRPCKRKGCKVLTYPAAAAGLCAFHRPAGVPGVVTSFELEEDARRRGGKIEWSEPDPPAPGPSDKALDVQVGGSHYKELAIQPVVYNHRNDLGFLEGNIVKYITRHRAKGGAQDLRKVIHYAQLLIELEYGEEP